MKILGSTVGIFSKSEKIQWVYFFTACKMIAKEGSECSILNRFTLSVNRCVSKKESCL
ncbi:Hypothetical protein LEPBI_I2440 [Leptospira biflexa serovar Patoc strain 'Patoc 1 (Paris)']|uniref:Uncharacterized protein n=1 Tax=Leptospira biflexa serovar Patoc (strain Patoc 1 / ATCC 23582 / Paris) TaxID=456481 RepID=B0SLE3_LEPBP|nr:Hypothetical protein LEPBI_I2440 [Leptospira biflexa serovar Patoc strain 'Patoc 1 (Paris)']